MIAKNKITKMDKKLIAAVALLLAVALIIGAYFIARAVAESGSGEGGSGEIDLDLIDGESYYAGIPIAYPTVEASKMQSIVISKQKGDEELKLSFALTRLGKDYYNNNFVMSFTNHDGETETYIPDIAFADSYFDYQELFAYTEGTTTASMPKITYITTAVGILYFDERIPLETDEAAKEAQLERYGFDEKTVIIFTYNTTLEDGSVKEEKHTISIGGKSVNGSTYYFTVDNRPYVYVTRTNYFDYALVNFESFLHTTLISAGLDKDGVYEPMFTPNYMQWENTVYKYDFDEQGNVRYFYVKDGEEHDKGSTDPWIVGDEDVLVGMFDAKMPVDYAASEPDGKGGLTVDNGYLVEKDVLSKFDLASLAGKSDYSYIIKQLLGADGEADNITLGKKDGLNLTVFLDRKTAEFKENSSSMYSYTVTEIESIFGPDGEIATVGTPVGSADAIKIAYTYKVDGEAYNQGNVTHAIVKLADLPDEARTALSAMTVGDITDYTFMMLYDKTTAYKSETKIIITDVFKVYSSSTGKYQQIVTDTSVVEFRYYTETDGVKSSDITSATLYLESIKEGDAFYPIKQALIGKYMALGQNIVANTTYRYCQPFYEFVTYENSELVYTVKSEIVTAFRFVNGTDRDPFYGESMYENTIGEIDGETPNRLYAINASSCETLVRLLGGIGETANTAVGLKGIETVAVGITPEIMDKYGLYAHTIYFELPRGIFDPKYEGATEDYFAWYEKIGYTLYISEKDPETGLRYIGSDMYDIVASVNGDDFDFLDKSFVELWARRNLLLVDVSDIASIEVDFNLTDFYGNYTFDFDHDLVYLANGQVYYNKDQVPSNLTPTEYDIITILSTLKGDASENAFTEYLSSKGKTSAWLGEFYRDVAGVVSSGNDNAGTGNFKYLLRMLYSLHYDGVLSEADKTEALDKIAGGELETLLTIKFKVVGNDVPYCFGFTRIDDGRVMVSIWQEFDGVAKNVTSDFYLSTFAFKKIAFGFKDLLNAREVDPELLPIPEAN